MDADDLCELADASRKYDLTAKQRAEIQQRFTARVWTRRDEDEMEARNVGAEQTREDYLTALAADYESASPEILQAEFKAAHPEMYRGVGEEWQDARGAVLPFAADPELFRESAAEIEWGAA